MSAIWDMLRSCYTRLSRIPERLAASSLNPAAFALSLLTGKCMFFDDCYEHEVWNRTGEERVLLLFDLWHPDLVKEVMQEAKAL